MINRWSLNALRQCPIIPVLVPASKDRISAAPFSDKSRMLFSFWRVMVCIVINVKIGSRTTTAPTIMIGGMPTSHLSYLDRFMMRQ